MAVLLGSSNRPTACGCLPHPTPFAASALRTRFAVFTGKAAFAGASALAVFALFAAAPFRHMTAGLGRFANVMDLMLLGLSGAAIYALILFAGLQLAGVRLRRLRS